jgi:hypothetical protein
MTHSPRSFLVAHRSIAAACLALSTALACAARPSSTGVAAPARTPNAAGEADARSDPETAARPAPESEPADSSATADSVVSLIAKPSLWPLDVESARRVLTTLGPVTLQHASSDELSLVGGPFGALEGFDVAYVKDDDNYWVFGSAGFFLHGADLGRLHRDLELRLIELLGKPAWSRSERGAALPTSGWKLGEGITLSLAPCRSERPCLAVTAASDADDREKLADEEEKRETARLPVQD